MRRKPIERQRSNAISEQEIEQLRDAIRYGWPWRLHEDDQCRSVPLSEKLQIVLSHLTGVFTLPCGFGFDPHPSDKTLEFLRSELATDLAESEKDWGHLVPFEERWSSNDLRYTTPAQGIRELY